MGGQMFRFRLEPALRWSVENRGNSKVAGQFPHSRSEGCRNIYKAVNGNCCFPSFHLAKILRSSMAASEAFSRVIFFMRRTPVGSTIYIRTRFGHSLIRTVR